MLHAIARWLFDPAGLTPHGFCLTWRPGLLWTHAVSDLVIGLAYLSIPATIGVVIRRRRDLVFRPMFLAFALFILLCGAGHLLDVVTLWLPLYGATGALKVATAAISVVTSAMLWRLLPQALALPSPAQLRQANMALHEVNSQLKLAEQIARVGHWRLALPARTLEWSEEVFRILGFDPAGGVPVLADVLARYHPEDREMVAANLDRAIANGTAYRLQSRILRDGEVRHIVSRGIPQHGADGTLVALFGVIIDKTEILRAAHAREEVRELNVRAQMAEEATRAKSRFLATVSHELRTPLNGVLGNAQLLRMDGGLSEVQRLRVDTMLQAGDHLLQMINRVLNLSEIEADHLTLDLHPVELRGMARLCLEMVRPAAAAKLLELCFSADPDVPQTVRTDPLRLRQVLLNLLGNAVKFTARGAVSLHLRVPGGVDHVRIEVTDTGPGISPEQRRCLFRDYERLDADNVATVEGAGLGLAISARLVAMLGGALGHQDHPGGGAVFWVELPCRSGPDDPLPAKPAPDQAGAEAAPASAPRRLRILVADDVAMNRDIAQAFLRAPGHDVVAVEGGEQALQALEAEAFDAVFMDLRMAGMSGLEASRRIRAASHRNRDVPIVALTASVFTEQMEECARAGMNGHVTKPFTPKSLTDALQAALRGKASAA